MYFTESKQGSMFLEDHLLMLVLNGTYTIRYGDQVFIVSIGSYFVNPISERLFKCSILPMPILLSAVEEASIEEVNKIMMPMFSVC